MSVNRSVPCQVPRTPIFVRFGETISKPGRSGVTMNAVTFSFILPSPLVATGVLAITVIMPARAALVANFLLPLRT